MREIKLAILGGGSVGKSALTVRYTHGAFPVAYDPTIEDSYRKEVLLDGCTFGLEILDTAGLDLFAAMRELYIRNSEGFVLVYSVDSVHSFRDVEMIHNQVVAIKESQDVPIVLVGNKCDLDAADREVSTADGRFVAKSWGCSVPFFETSAKDNVNVAPLFEALVRQVLSHVDSPVAPPQGAPQSAPQGVPQPGVQPDLVRIPSPVSSLASFDLQPKRSPPKLSLKRSLSKLKRSKSLRKLVSVASLSKLKHHMSSSRLDGMRRTLSVRGDLLNPESPTDDLLAVDPQIPMVQHRRRKRRKHLCVVM